MILHDFPTFIIPSPRWAVPLYSKLITNENLSQNTRTLKFSALNKFPIYTSFASRKKCLYYSVKNY